MEEVWKGFVNHHLDHNHFYSVWSDGPWPNVQGNSFSRVKVWEVPICQNIKELFWNVTQVHWTMNSFNFHLNHRVYSINPNSAGILNVEWVWGNNVPAPPSSTKKTVKNQTKNLYSDSLKWIWKSKEISDPQTPSAIWKKCGILLPPHQ